VGLERSGQEAVTVLDAIDRDVSVVPSVTVGVDTVEGVGVTVLKTTIFVVVGTVGVWSAAADFGTISVVNGPGNFITPRNGCHGDMRNSAGGAEGEVVGFERSGSETGAVGLTVDGHATSVPSIAPRINTVQGVGGVIGKTTVHGVSGVVVIGSARTDGSSPLVNNGPSDLVTPGGRLHGHGRDGADISDGEVMGLEGTGKESGTVLNAVNCHKSIMPSISIRVDAVKGIACTISKTAGF
jgi:hypothetical protein